MRSHDITYKGILLLSVLFDVVLCAALLTSLVYYFYNGKEFSHHYILGFSAFFVLFILFLVSLMIALHTRRLRMFLLTVAITVARFLCAIIVVIAWLSDYEGSSENDRKSDDSDPYSWISNRKFYLLIFTAIYMPIFCLQLYILNRYYSQASRQKYTPAPDKV